MSGCPDCDQKKEEARLEKERGERDERHVVALIGGGILGGLIAPWIGSLFISDISTINTIATIGVVIGATLGVVWVYWSWRKR